jgi:hypothetical protein
MYIYRPRVFTFENRHCGVPQNSLSINLQPRTLFGRQWLYVVAILSVVLAGGCSGMPNTRSNPAETAPRDMSQFTQSASLTATPASASFGTVAVGTKNTQTIQVRNGGSQGVTIAAAVVAGTGVTISGLSPPLTLASGATTSFTVGFSPSSSGSVTGSVTLRNSSGTTLVSIAMSGAGGTPTRTLALSTSSLNFGNENVGGSSILGVTLTNTGISSITVSQASASGSGFSVLSGVGGATIAAGQTAVLQVDFAPRASGSVTGTVTVTSNASNSPVSLRVSGTGVGSLLAGGGGSQHSVALSWNASASTSITGYNIYRSINASGSYSRINSSPTNATKYADGTVAAGETYYYVVTAVNSGGQESAQSNQISATIP